MLGTLKYINRTSRRANPCLHVCVCVGVWGFAGVTRQGGGVGGGGPAKLQLWP